MPLDGYEQRLIVDYEWVPTGFDNDDITAGVRGKHWFGDHVAVGATYVDEQRAGQDYSLRGADLTLQAGRGTYLKVEHSRSEATSAPVFFSDNGGLSFTRLNPDGPREGEATAVEARVNLRELVGPSATGVPAPGGGRSRVVTRWAASIPASACVSRAPSCWAT